MAAKETSRMIPLCHPLILNNVDMDFYFMDERNSILIRSIVMTNGKTGVEMEALHAVSVAALLSMIFVRQWNGGLKSVIFIWLRKMEARVVIIRVNHILISRKIWIIRF